MLIIINTHLLDWKSRIPKSPLTQPSFKLRNTHIDFLFRWKVVIITVYLLVSRGTHFYRIINVRIHLLCKIRPMSSLSKYKIRRWLKGGLSRRNRFNLRVSSSKKIWKPYLLFSHISDLRKSHYTSKIGTRPRTIWKCKIKNWRRGDLPTSNSSRDR